MPVEPLVFKTLLLLLTHPHRAVSKDELLAEVWPGKVVTEATLSNAVKLARKAVAIAASVRPSFAPFVVMVSALSPQSSPWRRESSHRLGSNPRRCGWCPGSRRWPICRIHPRCRQCPRLPCWVLRAWAWAQRRTSSSRVWRSI
ncbi:MAG: winged helix-turn-helix domain-containing protein [Xanthomonadales bacterium]|nr:winged helix-turn-helix domain-containing protein [Xanthomonadales bacterium]